MDHSVVASLLADARIRTLLLIAPLDAEELQTQHSPLMSPIVWDLGHIAHFEELWLVQNIGPDPAAKRFGEIPGMYNPFENPRAVRGSMRLPSPRESLDIMAGIRRRVLDHLPRVDLDNGSRLLEGGFVFHMVAQHEHQHDETILQTLQLKRGAPYATPRAWAVPERPEGSALPDGEMVRFDGGEVVIGTDTHPAAYDNERPSYLARVEPFSIDVAPVTNGAYTGFMEAGGYLERAHWSEAGWAWREESGAETPLYWYREGGKDGEWHTRVMDRTGPVPPEHPVCHVTYYEAEAYASWAGKRLPTELEWETASSWDPSSGSKRVFPWGDDAPTTLDANVDQLAFGTAPVGAYPRNVSPLGCHGMIGDVWEWTSSTFSPWPGYETFPYPEYSEVFFGPDYRVLRGGSWATRSGAIRNTFRNWDYPIRRQIFSGFRCASDD
ncbi:MAG TPA: ergothioneine biosynthesis protein EgtB [Longimicrobiales bacterium]|nr:ergothioneine biosynthesis protein EgtB [Longimicrobiales bacterium]